MLVVTRKLAAGENRIVIGDNIIVTLIGIDGLKIRVGISAPKEMPIYREETMTAQALDAAEIASGYKRS